MEGKVHGAAKGNLMFAVQTIRPEIMLRTVKVRGNRDKVIVGCGGDVALQLIGDLQVKISDLPERMIQVLLQRRLQRSIFGVADGKQHLVSTKICINARESGARCWGQARAVWTRAASRASGKSAKRRISGIEAAGKRVPIRVEFR